MIKKDLILVFLRIGLGFIFLWAFFDKLFGLGFATSFDKSWIVGGSPTSGFLEFGTSGPFASFFQSLAGSILVDWIFMIGLLLIGFCLILGIAKKISGYAGSILLFFMWLAILPLKNNPFIDDHIIYIFILIFLANTKTKFSLRPWWINLKFVKKYPFLK